MTARRPLVLVNGVRSELPADDVLLGAPGRYYGPTPPSNTVLYPVWIDTTDGTEYAWYDDGDSQQWVEFSAAGTTAGSDSSSTGSSPYLLAYDEKPQGTAAGTSLTGVNTRVLNTLALNAISGAALSANQLTLPAGTYFARASAPCYHAGRTALYLYNTSTSSTLVRGQSFYVGATIDVVISVALAGQFTLTSAGVIELRHQIGSGATSNGLGVEVNQASTGAERYAQLEVWKVG